MLIDVAVVVVFVVVELMVDFFKGDSKNMNFGGPIKKINNGSNKFTIKR